MRIAIAFVLFAVCHAGHAAPPGPAADPVSLFEGRSSGSGELRILLGKARAFRVESVGRALPDGTFRLDQRIRFEGEPVRDRHWILRATAPGRHAFSLSDASGMGMAVVDGPRLTLRYPLGRGLSMRQVLVPSRDGRSIANRGTIHWLGIPVGRLIETITREETAPAARPPMQASSLR